MMAVKYCCEQEFIESALILIYAEIDILSWLGLPANDGSNSATNRGFKTWVDQFMLGNTNSKLRCNSSDLWAARCSVLHTGATHSDNSAQGKANQLFYAYGAYETQALQSLIEIDPKLFPRYQNVHVVHLEKELLHDFENAVHKFFNHNFDPDWESAIIRRIKMMLAAGNTKQEDVQAANLYLQNKGFK